MLAGWGVGRDGWGLVNEKVTAIECRVLGEQRAFVKMVFSWGWRLKRHVRKYKDAAFRQERFGGATCLYLSCKVCLFFIFSFFTFRFYCLLPLTHTSTRLDKHEYNILKWVHIKRKWIHKLLDIQRNTFI